MSTLTERQTSIKYWGPVAYTRLFLYTTAYILRGTVRHIFRRTPKGRTLLQTLTIQLLKLVMSLRVTNVAQTRKLMNFSNGVVHLRSGTLTQKSRSQWATKVKGHGWEGYWIPFKNQNTASKAQLQAQHAKKVSLADVGADCDIVMFAIHGGGFLLGDASMWLTCHRSWMKLLHQKHNVKIGVLSVEYSLSPETKFPGALNECVAAYRHLVEHQGIDPKRIVMCGDSAGGNLCLTTALKLRDDYPHIPLPAGQVLFSPYVPCPQPFKDSPDDYITHYGGQMFVEGYTQNLVKIQTSPYFSPINAPSLAGLPKQLIYIGGVEALRPSIERYVNKARADGVEVQDIMKEGMAHDYCLIEEISGRKAMREAEEILAKFVAQIRNESIGIAVSAI